MTIECPRCAHLRVSTDAGPQTECPKCGIIYAKFDPASEQRLASLRAKAERRAPASRESVESSEPQPQAEEQRPRPAFWRTKVGKAGVQVGGVCAAFGAAGLLGGADAVGKLLLVSVFVLPLWLYMDSERKKRLEADADRAEREAAETRRRAEQAALKAQLKLAMENAFAAYLSAMDSVKADPTNADLRAIAVRLGRASSDASHRYDGRIIVPEARITNDLEAATAGAANVVSKATVDERLRLLGELLASGRITQQEHDQRRSAIIDAI